jgi:hypothetical protein
VVSNFQRSTFNFQPQRTTFNAYSDLIKRQRTTDHGSWCNAPTSGKFFVCLSLKSRLNGSKSEKKLLQRGKGGGEGEGVRRGGGGWENEGVGQYEGEIQGQKLPVCVPY